jgi:asparagine synthase (glutamine-hydrolysing)
LSVIAGYWDLSGRRDSLEVACKMMACIHGLAQDRVKWKSERGWALGHYLIRITPEDELERQPLRGDEDGWWLLADARIDNREELAGRLGISQNILPTLSDSQIIARSWLHWERGCVDYLVGAFAFVIWKPTQNQFFLVRDHAGDRPLFYAKTVEGFAFATSVHAILACPGVDADLCEEQLARDLVGLPPTFGNTRFRNVQTLPPGCTLTVRPDSVQLKRYWRYDALPRISFSKNEEYVEAFLEIFDEAVRCRLRCSGQIASELSSGLDSGSVTATAAVLLAQQGRSLNAYTSIPRPNSSASGRHCGKVIEDEGPFAAELAALYPNINHTFIDSGQSDMLRELEKAFHFLGLPCAGPLNLIWVHRILDCMKASGAKVLLNGALGNFTISYTGDEHIYPLFHKGAWLETLREARRLRKIGLSSGRHTLSLTLFSVLPWDIRRRLDPLIRQTRLGFSAIHTDFAKAANLVDHFRRYTFERTTDLPRCQETYFHRNQYGDYNAAANIGWEVDVRDPTADKRIYEFCVSIPPEQYLVGEQGRSLIRRAMAQRLPTNTLMRTLRGAQSADWFESLSDVRIALEGEINQLRTSSLANRLIDLDRLSGAVRNWPRSRDAVREIDLYQYALPRGIACGFFIRRAEEIFSNPGSN